MAPVITFERIIPILRIFDIGKADEFYLDFLGFSVDWEHRFDVNAPTYRQVSREGIILHLSEHHGDGGSGAHLRISIKGVEALQRELIGKVYRYMRPGLERTSWHTLETTVIDPFSNRLTFSEGLPRQDI
jgi:Glyoxalase superfamily protein